MESKLERFVKHVGRNANAYFVSAVVLGIISSWELTAIAAYKTINPVKQYQLFGESWKKAKAQKKRYEELYPKVMEYADQDKNGGIDFNEQADAWRRMGYKGPFFQSKNPYNPFPTPTLEDLERAITSYEKDN